MKEPQQIAYPEDGREGGGGGGAVHWEDIQNFEHKTLKISMWSSLNISFGCSKEPSH